MRTNIRLIFLGATLLAGVFLGSCKRDELTFEPTGKLKPGLNLTVNTLGVGGDVAPSNGDTKAAVSDPTTLAGTEAERTTKTLDLFLFDSGDGSLVAHTRMSESGGQIGGISSIFPATNANNTGTAVNMNINELINAGGFGTRTLAVVANWDEAAMGSVLKTRLDIEGGSLSTLEQMVVEAPFATAAGVQGVPFAAGGLLMFGKSANVTYDAASPTPGFGVDLVRMTSRVDLKLSVSGSMAAATQIAEVRVMQAADKAYMAATTVAVGESTLPNYTVQNKSTDGLFINAALNTAHTIYLPENNLKVGTYSRLNATYILVNIPEGGTDNWYRFWVNESDNRTVDTYNYHLKRNTIYQITSVISSKGGATPDVAVETNETHFGDVFCTLTYNVQPGMIGKPEMKLVKLGETVTVESITDAGAAGRDRYPVVLNTAHDETGTVYYPGDTFTITGNTTLHARLRPTAPRITLAADGTLAITYDARDAGLLFKFGSVVGIYSGHHANNDMRNPVGDTFDAGDVAYNPSGVSIGAWDDIPNLSAPVIALDPHLTHNINFITGGVMSAPSGGGIYVDASFHTQANVLAGQGDPCRLVGLTQAQIQAGIVDNGTWRLSTDKDNYRTLSSAYQQDQTNVQWDIASSPWGVVGNEYPRKNSNAQESFFPMLAGRYSGVLNFYGGYGSNGPLYYYAPSDGTFASGLSLTSNIFHEWNNITDAFAIRCVRQAVPRITIGTGSDGHPMLTLTDDPTDVGLLFKYGSTTGLYSAGGQRNLNNSTGWTPFVSDPWSADDVAFNPVGTTYTNYLDVPFEATAPIVDKAYHDAPGRVTAGKGDPCRLVGLTLTQVRNNITDNGLWRLPTHAEVLAMFPSPDRQVPSATYPGTTLPGYKFEGASPYYYGWLPQSVIRSPGDQQQIGYSFSECTAHYSQSLDIWVKGFHHAGVNGGAWGGYAYNEISGIRFCVRQ